MVTGHPRASARYLLLLVSVLSAGGCSNLRIYSETRDQQGAAALEAWKAVDLDALVATERENLKKLLETELEAQDQLASGIRDHGLRAMVTGTETVSGALIQPANELLARLLGGSQDLQAAEDALSTVRENTRALESARGDFSIHGIKVPDCEDLNDGASPQWLKEAIERLAVPVAAVASADLQKLRDECAKPRDSIDVYRSFEGELGAALNQYERDLEALQSMRADAAGRRDAFSRAKAAYEQAVKDDQTDPKAVEKVKEAATQLRDALTDLQSAQDALSIELLSGARIEAIDSFFQAVTETNPGEKHSDSSKAALAFVVLPKFIDEAKQALADGKKPLAMPLLIRRNYEELRLEGAKREIALREKMVDLSRQLLDATYDEAHEVWLVERVSAKHLSGVKDLRFADAFAQAKGDTRLALYEAVARYLDAINRRDASRYKLQYTRIAAVHELSLAYAEVNMKQWQSLIGASVQQASDFSGGGIKAEQIIDLLNAAGVIWIGAGVN